jgi:ketosteroid isomerase-like protein
MTEPSNPADAAKARVIAARHRWVAAIAARDPQQLRDLLWDDYEVWANAAPPIQGIDAAIAAMSGALERFDIVQSFEPIETVVSGDWAFERGIESMNLTPRAGGQSQVMRQRALLILRRGPDGAWRYARGMTNALPAAPGAAP